MLPILYYCAGFGSLTERRYFLTSPRAPKQVLNGQDVKTAFDDVRRSLPEGSEERAHMDFVTDAIHSGQSTFEMLQEYGK